MRIRSSSELRSGFTLPEILITILIATTLLGVVYTLLTATTREQVKTQELASAANAASLVLFALETDLANVIPGKNPTATVAIGEDPPADPTMRYLQFARRSTKAKLGFADPQWDPIPGAIENVEYRAVKRQSGLWSILRVTDPRMAGERAVQFMGAYARDVRFTRSVRGTAMHFVRITMMLYGKDVAPESIPDAANRPKPIVLTTLRRVTTK